MKQFVKRERALLQRYNVSRKQIHALASLFSGSDQVNYTFPFTLSILLLHIVVAEDNS